MFINTGDEHHGTVAQTLVAGQGVAGDGRVGTAEMGLVVDVIKRSCEGVGHLESGNSAAPQRRRILTTILCST